jgi:hypothetical protein
VLLDLAMSVAIGGCLADIVQVRAEPGLFGQVASDPTVSRLVDNLAADAPRASVGGLGQGPSTRKGRFTRTQQQREHTAGIDLDASFITVDSEKELAAATFKRGAWFTTRSARGLRQLPSTDRVRRPGRNFLIRTDGAGGTHEFLSWLTRHWLFKTGGHICTGSMATESLDPDRWQTALPRRPPGTLCKCSNKGAKTGCKTYCHPKCHSKLD